MIAPFREPIVPAVAASDTNVIPTIQTHSAALAKRKTILFVTKTGEYGGAERHLIELVRRVIGPDVKLSILCLDQDLYTSHLNPEDAAQVQIIRCEKSAESFWNWYRIFRRYPADVVVFVRAWLWCYRWYAPIAAWMAGIPRRITIAHLTPPPGPRDRELRSIAAAARRVRHAIHLAKLRVSALFQDSTICVSNAIRDALIHEYGFPADRTVTIHNSISLTEFDEPSDAGLALRAKLGVGGEEFLLVCVARLSEQKRIDILLLAMARLLRDGVNCKCVIVGDGPLREELLSQARALALTGHVIFEGFQRDIKPYLRAGTAFVLTSDREGFSLAILEAMACGLPCVVTNVGGAPEVIADRVQGFLVSPGSADEVANAISYLVSHPSEREEMSQRARTRVSEQFSIETCMAEIKKLVLH